MVAGLIVLLGAPTGLAAQEALCSAADEYLMGAVGMTTIVEADTIDDWRTDQMVPGCRITAAGLTTKGLRAEARSFYEQLRATDWTRTPDPQDAPNEASLRFRNGGSDCLFNFYSDGLLGTDAELEVDDAVVPGRGQQRYNFLVLCMPAVDLPPG
ncbi:MAG: hypothetical protein ACR2QM_02160 [Longimicrobiales bacterium]